MVLDPHPHSVLGDKGTMTPHRLQTSSRPAPSVPIHPSLLVVSLFFWSLLSIGCQLRHTLDQHGTITNALWTQK